jgi:hypothetical protein
VLIVKGAPEYPERLVRNQRATARSLSQSDRQTVRRPIAAEDSKSASYISVEDETTILSESQVTAVVVKDTTDERPIIIAEEGTADTTSNIALSDRSEMALPETTDRGIVPTADYFETAAEAKIREKTDYSRGRMFKIFDEKNRHINDRTMIALASTRHSSIVCLALCEHGDLEELDDDEFWDTHMVVHNHLEAHKASKPSQSHHEMLSLDIPEKWALRPGTCLNLEHVYTIKITNVKVVFCGKVLKANISTMMDAHCAVYQRMLRRGFKASDPNPPKADAEGKGQTETTWG